MLYLQIWQAVVVSLCILFLTSTILDVIFSKKYKDGGFVDILKKLTRTGSFLGTPVTVLAAIGTPRPLRQCLESSPILYYPTMFFPEASVLRSHWKDIRAEAYAAEDAWRSINQDQFFTNAEPGWKRFYIKWYGPIDPKARQLCPRTSALIESMTNVHLAMFSILEPGVRIPPHYGPARFCLRYHLALEVPKETGCKIRVRDTEYEWKEGEDVMFDDTFLHSVENLTSQRRIVLFLDVERPQRSSIFTAINRFFIHTLGAATTRTNDKQEVAVSRT